METTENKKTPITTAENAKKNEKDKTYKTGSTNVTLWASVLSIVSLAGIYFTKK